MEIKEYLDQYGASPFRKWFYTLKTQAAAKITVVLEKIANGNLSNVKGVGAGVVEFKLEWGFRRS